MFGLDDADELVFLGRNYPTAPLGSMLLDSALFSAPGVEVGELNVQFPSIETY